MIGAAGSMLERIFRRNGWQRGQVRIFNTINCLPPGMELRGAPYEHSAIAHCAVHRAPVLASPHQVIVAAGAIALRNRLQLEGLKSIRVEDFHGTVHDDPERPGKFVVPTFHPSFLQRGAHNLIGTVSFDLQLAKEVALGQWQHQPIDRILDPPLEWVRAALSMLQQQVAHDPGSVMIASDIETPDKEGGKAENELTPDDDSYQIKRVNFAWHPDQGCTLPYIGEYIPLIHAIAELPCWHLWWNGYGYDWARCAGNQFSLPWRWQLDGMVAAHVLQSDVPLGLGFWAPFYSRFGAWKHRSESDPVDYAAIDGPQTFRTVSGVIGDLVASGQWQAFHDHCHVLYHDVLKPAQDVGILIDQPELQRFHHDLEVKQRRLIHELQACIPDELRPLTGETSKPPDEATLHPAARTHTLRTGELLKSQPDPVKKDLYALVAQRVHRRVPRMIQVCKTCGKAEVSKTHVCKDDHGKPAFVNDPANPARFIPAVPNIQVELWEVSRWFWQEPFNPDSAPQILAYLKFRGHKPGKDKHTRKDSANRDTLLRLAKSTKDPLYKLLLDYRAVKKVDSTYAVPTMRRAQADPEGRIHPLVTFRPSMGRLCIAAGTPIEIARDLYTYPKGIPIEEVQPGSWAYTFDDQRRLTLRRVISVAKTGHRRVVRLHWMAARVRKGRDRFGWLDLTAEHEVRLTDGTYKQAQHLQQGDRVLAMTRGLTAYGYARLWATGHKQINEHRFIVRQITGQSPEHVHHQNHKPLDNRPENLEGQTRHDHLVYHGQRTGPAVAEGRRQRMLRRWKEAPEQFADRPAPNLLNLSREWLEQALAWAEGHPTYIAKRYKIDYATRMKYIDQYGLPCHRKPRRQVAYNHTVVFIEVREEQTDVYDLEIEDTHNFIAGELCVHNSYVSPNITNIVQDKGGKESLAAGFRRAVVAGPSCRLLEVDFASAEPTEVGWLIRDPNYLRLAKLGSHAYVTSHLLGRPADLHWSDADLGAYLKAIKSDERHAALYDKCKRANNGINYGLTAYGMAETFPEVYKDQADAQKIVDLIFALAPNLPIFHNAVQQRAYDVGYLGGVGPVMTGATAAVYNKDRYGKALDPTPFHHPFGYQHWFWSVLAYKPITEKQRLWREKRGRLCIEINGRWFAVDRGEDAKRVIAWGPQSIAAGVLKRSMLALFAHPDHPSYIGDAYFGRTPLRAPIHDSLLLEVPDRQWDRVVEAVAREMQRPIQEQPLPKEWGMGEYLSIGADAKVGQNWKDAEKLKLPAFTEVATEGTYFGVEEIDEDDAAEMGIVA